MPPRRHRGVRSFVGSRRRPVLLKGLGRPVRVGSRQPLESSMSSSHARVRGLVALSALLLGTSMLTACDNGDDIAQRRLGRRHHGLLRRRRQRLVLGLGRLRRPGCRLVLDQRQAQDRRPGLHSAPGHRAPRSAEHRHRQRVRRRRRAPRRDRRRRQRVEGRRPARARHVIRP